MAYISRPLVRNVRIL